MSKHEEDWADLRFRQATHCPKCGSSQRETVLSRCESEASMWHVLAPATAVPQDIGSPRTLTGYTTDQIKAWPVWNDRDIVMRDEAVARATAEELERSRALEQEPKAVQDVVRGQWVLGTWYPPLEQPPTSPSDATSGPVSDDPFADDRECLNCGHTLPEATWYVAKWCNGGCYTAWQMRIADEERQRREDMAEMRENLLPVLWDICYFGGTSVTLRITGTHGTYNEIVVNGQAHRYDTDDGVQALVRLAASLRKGTGPAPQQPSV